MFGPYLALALAGGLGWFANGCSSATPAAPVVQQERRCELPDLHDPNTDLRVYLQECALSEVVALTSQLIRFPTVSAEHPPAQGGPFTQMADFLAKWAEDHGLGFRVFGEHDAWEITLGEGPRTVGLLVHADVVPVGPPHNDRWPVGWGSAPFEGTVRGGRLYGRGAEDDKGPMAVAMGLLKLLAELGVELNGQLAIVAGTAEESDWSGMERYAKSEPHPKFMVSLDSGFPVVVGENGYVAWYLAVPQAGKRPHPDRPIVEHAQAGTYLTQIPNTATMVLRPPAGTSVRDFMQTVRQALAQEAQANEAFHVEVHMEKDVVRVSARGRAGHASRPEDALNAVWPIARVARCLDVAPFGYGAMLHLLAEFFADDHFGEGLGLAHEHPVMGPLVVAPTLLFETDAEVRLGINMRRPAGVSADDFASRLESALATMQEHVPALQVADGSSFVEDPVLVDPDSTLVHTLLEVYRKHTGDKIAAPVTIRGGTYARLFDGSVSFGPSFPNTPYRGHGADEYIEISALHHLLVMLLEAVLRLDGLAVL